MVELHGPALLRFCIARLGAERAEDCFQEAMLAALRAYDTVRDPGAIRAWLFSIAARKAADAERSRARTRALEAAAAEQADRAGVATAEPDAALGEREIWDLVRALPAKQREALALRFLADLSHREIAAAMDTSEEAARRNVFEALRRLRSETER